MLTPQARTHTYFYPRVVKRCTYCHSEFDGIYCQRYCDSVCRNRAYYQRKQDRLERASQHNRAQLRR